MRWLSSTFALAVLCSTLVIGQQRGAQPPTVPGPPGPPAPAVPGQRGGGGRGRGNIQVMTLASTAWPDGGQIPARHTQEGDDVSPPLTWSGAPEGIVSFALLVHDSDAPVGNGTDDLLH